MRTKGGGSAARTAEGSPLQMPLWAPRDATPGWHVRISRRARRLSMRVFPGGRVEVVVPPGAGIPAIERFVSQHRDWAERRAREFALLVPEAGQRRPASVELALLGQRWEVEYHAAKRTSVADRGDGVLRVHTADGADSQVSHALLRWLAGVAVRELGTRLDEKAGEVGIGYSRMHLRRQRTRWGSCSSAGTISLNVCLMFQSPAVVRYLMVHELCHRVHMNHSTRYWQLVESFEPHWRVLDAELLKGWRHVPAWVFPA
jgi:predicted metal-dependent hydrolase